MRYRYRTKPETTFDTETGLLIRTGKERPRFAELIDLKVTNRCGAGCFFCYQDSTRNGKEADVGQVIAYLESLEEKPFQIAIGGGEPSKWKGLYELLHWCEVRNVVANMAVGPSAGRTELCIISQMGPKAIGVSFVDEKSFLQITGAMRGNGAKIMAHLVLRSDMIDEWVSRAEWWPPWIEGFVFLYYKKHGRGVDHDLVPTREQMERVYEAYKDENIGYDSCCFPFVKDKASSLVVEDCDGGMYSMYWDAVEGTYSQCSFLSTLGWGSLQKAWDMMGPVTGCNHQMK